MSYNKQLSEQLAVVARITPAVKTAGAEVLSDAIDMQNHGRILAIFNMGVYAGGNNGSVAVVLKAATTSGGSYSLITGKAITTASFTGSANDDAVALIELTQEELATIKGPTYRYVKLSVTPTNQNLACGAVVLGDYSRYTAASEYDIATVKEIIA